MDFGVLRGPSSASASPEESRVTFPQLGSAVWKTEGVSFSTTGSEMTDCTGSAGFSSLGSSAFGSSAGVSSAGTSSTDAFSSGASTGAGSSAFGSSLTAGSSDAVLGLSATLLAS